MSTLSLTCPSCGEAERLQGSRQGELIVVQCEACGHEWHRDPTACPRCGSRAVVDRREPLYQKARGTQQSIVAYRIVQECTSCGSEW